MIVMLVILLLGVAALTTVGLVEYLKLRHALKFEAARCDALIHRLREVENLHVYLEVSKTCVLLYGLTPDAVERAVEAHLKEKGQVYYESFLETVIRPVNKDPD